MQPKQMLAKALEGREAGRNQLVHLTAGLVVLLLKDKPPGACDQQAVLLAAVAGLKPNEEVHQMADPWLVILGEL